MKNAASGAWSASLDRGRRVCWDVVETARSQKQVFAALVCYWVWQLFFFQSPFSGLDKAGVLVTGVPEICLLGTSLVAYGLAQRWEALLSSAAERRFYLVFVGGALAGGTVCFCLAPSLVLFPVLSWTLALAGSIAMGAAAALYIIEMSRLFSQLGPRFALFLGVGSLLLAALGLGVVSLLPFAGQGAVLVGAAVGALVFLSRARSQFPRKRLFSWGQDTAMRKPIKLLVTCFVQGAALGIMSALDPSASSGMQGSFLTATAFALGALVLLATAGLLSMDFNHLLYQIGFPLMALGFLGHVCLPGNVGVSEFLFGLAHCYVYVLMTCICSYFSNCLKCSPVWIVALTTLCMVGGQLMGVLLVGIAGALSLLPMTAMGLSGVMTFLLPVAALLLLSNDNPVSGWGAMRPDQRGEEGDRALFAKIASDYQLTAREHEITEYLARGRNKRYISQELDLSEETVKTHMGNIYRKLLVHSQQELIDLVEKERQARDR